MIRRRLISAARLSCRYNATFEVSGSRSRRHRWFAHVCRRSLLRVISGFLQVLSLSGDGRDMSLTCGGLLLRCRTRINSPLAPVEADMINRGHIHSVLVYIVNLGDVYVEHGAVIEKVTIIPTAALKPLSEISETIVDSSVETNLRPPVPVVENESTVAPAPVGRCPQESHFRRHNPCSRHPVIVVEAVIVGPIARRPQIA